MAVTNGSGIGRVTPNIHTANNHKGNTSLDDDERQRPINIVGFTVQAMISGNNSQNATPTNPAQMDF